MTKENYIFVNEYYDYMYVIGVIENIQGFVKVQKKGEGWELQNIRPWDTFFSIRSTQIDLLEIFRVLNCFNVLYFYLEKFQNT